VSENFNLDHHVIVEVAKSFAGHVALPKEKFTVYEPPKIIESTSIVHAPVETVVALIADGFYEKPPYPAKVKKNNKILETLMKKSAQKSYTPCEQVQVHPNVSTIKALNQEEPYNIYLYENATEVVK
jgi:hypothetical protein